MNNRFAFLDVKQAAAMLGVHKETIRRMLRSGRLRGRRVGKKWYIEADSVHELLGIDAAESEAERILAPLREYMAEIARQREAEIQEDSAAIITAIKVLTKVSTYLGECLEIAENILAEHGLLAEYVERLEAKGLPVGAYLKEGSDTIA